MRSFAIFARHRPVRRDHVDVEFVDVVELGGFGFRGAGHAGELLIEPEIILDRDRRERLRLAIDLHAFLRFHRLVQAIAPAAARHFAAGVFVDNDDLVFLDDVLHVFLEEAVGAQQLRDVVNPLGLRVAMLLALRFSASLSPRPRASGSRSISVNSLIKSGSTNASGSSGFMNARPCSERSDFLRFLVDGEEQLFLEREEFFLARVLVELQFGLVDRAALVRILHHAEELFVARLTELDLEHERGRLLRLLVLARTAPSLRWPAGCKACSACARAVR